MNPRKTTIAGTLSINLVRQVDGEPDENIQFSITTSGKTKEDVMDDLLANFYGARLISKQSIEKLAAMANEHEGKPNENRVA